MPRVADDIVVSAFLAARGITVKDVPGFSFGNRPWQSESADPRVVEEEATTVCPDRDAQNGRCHDWRRCGTQLARGGAAAARGPEAHGLRIIVYRGSFRVRS